MTTTIREESLAIVRAPRNWHVVQRMTLLGSKGIVCAFASIELNPAKYTIELHRPGNAHHRKHSEQNREKDCGTNRDFNQHADKAIPSHRDLHGGAVVPIALARAAPPAAWRVTNSIPELQQDSARQQGAHGVL